MPDKESQPDKESHKPDHKPMVPFTVRFDADALEHLINLGEITRINEREWIRALVDALLARWQEQGALTLPLAVVTLEEAKKAGLLGPRPPGLE
jgi:hypothetical protein